MEILYLLIPIGLLILAIAIKMLFWAVKSGQYDDLDKEGHRILFDDDQPASSSDSTPKNKQ
jgi:cbb3-type cytochrome oxidase maturation protein